MDAFNLQIIYSKLAAIDDTNTVYSFLSPNLIYLQRNQVNLSLKQFIAHIHFFMLLL